MTGKDRDTRSRIYEDLGYWRNRVKRAKEEKERMKGEMYTQGGREKVREGEKKEGHFNLDKSQG